MSVLLDIVRPWKTYRNRQEVEKKLRKRETVDVDKYNAETHALRVQRDMEKILSKYIDSGKYRSITLQFSDDCLDPVVSILERQGQNYTLLEDNKIIIRG